MGAAHAEDVARMTIKTLGKPMEVEFRLSTETECPGADARIGTVYDPEPARKVLLPWIANMSEKLQHRGTVPLIERELPVGQRVYLLARNSWYDRDNRLQHCRTDGLSLTPEAGHAYSVEYTVSGANDFPRCEMWIYDVTEPEARTRVRAYAHDCSPPQRWFLAPRE